MLNLWARNNVTLYPRGDTDMILLNPRHHDRYYPDERSREIMLKTIAFFEGKGLDQIKEDDRTFKWYKDFL